MGAENNGYGVGSNGTDAHLCSNCKSIYHKKENCPQKNHGGTFKSSKERGLAKGTLPFKFRVEIDPDKDDVPEVARKGALLRLNADKIYRLMASSIKAHESQKESLKWLGRVADELDIDDPFLQEERNKLLPLLMSIKSNLEELEKVRAAKIRQAEEMEESVIEGRKKARKARERASKKGITPLEVGSLKEPAPKADMPTYEGEMKSPSDLFKELANEIVKKEKRNLNEKE